MIIVSYLIEPDTILKIYLLQYITHEKTRTEVEHKNYITVHVNILLVRIMV